MGWGRGGLALESPLAEFCVFCPSPSSHPTAHPGALHGNPRCFQPTCCRCLAFFLEFTEIWGCSTSLSQASLGNLYTSSQRSPAPELGNQGLLGNWAAGPVFRDRPGCSESWRACRQPREQFLRGKGEASPTTLASLSFNVLPPLTADLQKMWGNYPLWPHYS